MHTQNNAQPHQVAYPVQIVSLSSLSLPLKEGVPSDAILLLASPQLVRFKAVVRLNGLLSTLNLCKTTYKP